MTRIAEVLPIAAAERRVTVSFEFFPPKSADAAAALRATLAELTPLHPDFISVTYGALGSTRETTRDLVIECNATLGIPTMAHLTCVGHTKAEISELLEAYAAGGVDNILALGGDPPADGSDVRGEFSYANELVDVVRSAGAFSVGVAAHPELHPRSMGDRDADRLRLAAKLDRADFAISQFFFDADHYFRLVDELRARGVERPVIPGVMPLISVAGVRRMAAMNGTEIPGWLSERLDAVDGDSSGTVELGIEVAIDLGRRLIDGGAPGLHLYALNRSGSVSAIVDALGLR